MWHQVIGQLAFHVAGCMKAALLVAVRGGGGGGGGVGLTHPPHRIKQTNNKEKMGDKKGEEKAKNRREVREKVCGS